MSGVAMRVHHYGAGVVARAKPTVQLDPVPRLEVNFLELKTVGLPVALRKLRRKEEKLVFEVEHRRRGIFLRTGVELSEKVAVELQHAIVMLDALEKVC